MTKLTQKKKKREDIEIITYSSIDKIKVGFRLDKKWFEEGLEIHPLNNLFDWCNQYNNYYIYNTNTNYADTFNLIGNLGTMMINKKEGSIYWEFNPNKIDTTDNLIPYIITELNFILDYKRSTWYNRIDIANDLDLNLDTYSLVSQSKRKECIYLHRGRKETHYLGTRESEIMFRFYDKEAECQKEKTPLPVHMVKMLNKTRFELQLNKQFEFMEPQTLINIFKDISIIPKQNVYDKLKKMEIDTKTALAISYIVQNDEYRLLDEFNPKTKAKLKEIIKDLKTPIKAINLEYNFSEICNRLNKFIKTLNVRDLIELPF